MANYEENNQNTEENVDNLPTPDNENPSEQEYDQADEYAEYDDEEDEQPRRNPFRPFIIVILALLVLGGVSMLPLGEITGGKVKDFNLLSDILNFDPRNDSTANSGSPIDGLDPELAKAMQNGAAEVVYNDSVLIDIKPNRVGDLVVIEDYTHQQQGMSKLREALKSGRLARVAVLGDSYIEGDIFTQDLRDQLQTRYGGSGVGYMNLYSEFPGFRRSIKQGGKGWTEHAAGKKAKAEYIGLSEHYFTSSKGAEATYEGSTRLTHTAEWDSSMVLFIAKTPTVLQTKTVGEEWTTHNVAESPDVQCITVPGRTGKFSLKSTDNSVIGLGVWLDAAKGISVDCMSSRGFSGISLSSVDSTLCTQMSKFIDYDLIVLEYGINAMSATQTKYDIYANRMAKVVERIRTCYPNADILIMGVGDRGQKKGGVVQSMATGKNMIDAQRELARRTHTFFWDTREAMGGDGAIAEWAKQGLANKDYVHLTHKGGKQLATSLFKAIENNLNL